MLDAATVPYHLFLYWPDGEQEGRFVHRSPDGRLRAIRNPDGVYKPEPEAAVVVKMNGGLDPRRELPGIPLSLTSLPWPWTGGARRTHLGETCPGSIRCSGGTRAGSKSWRPISTRTSSHSTRCSGANSGSRPGISAPKCRFNLTHDGAGSLSVLPESKQSQQSVHDYDRIGKQPTNHHTRSIDTGGVGH